MALTGPLQNFTINATGAFAAYVVTGLLGFFLVKDVATQIAFLRSYPIEGYIVDLGPTDGVDSDQFLSRTSLRQVQSQGDIPTHEVHFVVLFQKPLVKTQKINIDYWEIGGGSASGEKPAPKEHPSMELLPTPLPQRFRLEKGGDGRVRVVNETLMGKSGTDRDVEVALKGDQ